MRHDVQMHNHALPPLIFRCRGTPFTLGPVHGVMGAGFFPSLETGQPIFLNKSCFNLFYAVGLVHSVYHS